MSSEWLNKLRFRLKALARRKQLDRDLDEELAFHLAMREEERRAAGIGAEEARYAARREFGNYTRTKERTREMWTFTWLETIWQDLRYAARTLRKSPAYSAVAIFTLALGIGVNAGVFQIFNALALHPVEIGGSSRLLTVYQTFQIQHPPMHRNVHDSDSRFSYLEYKTYRDQNQVFSGLAALDPFVEVTLAGDQPHKLLGTLVSCNYFDVLGIRPAVGRSLVDSDCAAAGSGAVVVLSDDVWKSNFAGDPSIVGKNISLNHVTFTVAGVAPTGFAGTEIARSAFWTPLTMQPAIHKLGGPRPEALGDDDLSWLKLLGRVRDNLTNDQILADLNVVAARVDLHHPGVASHPMVLTPTFFDAPDQHQIILGVGTVILFAVGLVLLIACANVANLLLARSTSRRREIAVRLATGASRGRLVRQLLTESFLLASLGGVGGSLLAFWSFKALLAFFLSRLPEGSPSFNLHLSPDARVFGYLAGMTLLTAIAFGLVPALQATRMDVSAQLKDEGSDWQGHPGRGNRLRRSLVGLQVAVSMVLLIVAGLLLRALYRAQTIDPGFAIQNLQALSFDLSAQGYSPERAGAFEQELIARLSAMPGVQAVAQATSLPLSNMHNQTDAGLPGAQANQAVEFDYVSPNFFSTVSIPIVRGRTFLPEETQSQARTVVVTEAIAHLFWPGEDPIGKRLALSLPDQPPCEVVGIAKDAQVSHLGEDHPHYVYLPAIPAEQAHLRLVVRPVSGSTLSAKTVSGIVASLDPNLTGDVQPMTEFLEFWRIPARFAGGLSAALGILALLLASAGVYGTVCFAVSRRIREIGIRMTLGASARDVMQMILRQALRPVLIGAVIGIVCCAGICWGLSTILYGLSSYDPLAFVAVPLVQIAVALLASYLPARRATRVDPMVALRYE